MLLTEIERKVLEAASSKFQVYCEEQWADAAKGETKFNFIAALKDETPPIELRAHVEFSFDAIYTGALVYGTVYNKEGEEIEPEMDLEIKVNVPTDETKTIDMEKLQEAAAGIIGQELVIVHNERLTLHSTDKYRHLYTIEYFWTIGEENFLDTELYEDIFLNLERLLHYLKLKQRSEAER